MKVHNIILSVLAAGMIILGITQYYSGVAETHGENVDLTGFENMNESLQRHQELSLELSQKLNFTLETGVTALYTVPYKFIQIGWTSIKLVLNGMDTIFDMIVDSLVALDKSIGLPGYVIPSIIATLLVLIVFAVIYMFLKWKAET